PNRPDWGNNWPDRRPDWNQWNGWRQNNFTNVNNYWRNNWHNGNWNNWGTNDWWNRYPNWRYRWNNSNWWTVPVWGSLASWVPYGWSDPVYYNYGDNVYYQGDEVYYGDQPVATAQEYTDQAAAIAASIPQDVKPAESDWMSLGTFAIMPDGKPSDVDPTMFLQLNVSKQGIIAGT